MSWESSAEYYRLLNEEVRAPLATTASARCLLWSFDFAEIEALQHSGNSSRPTDPTAERIVADERRAAGVRRAGGEREYEKRHAHRHISPNSTCPNAKAKFKP